MIIGPFWCQRDNAWLRFNVENGLISAEITVTDARNETQWKEVSEGAWPTSYIEGDKVSEFGFYVLKEGILYTTDGSINNLTGAYNASVWQDGAWRRHNILKSNPFPENIKEEAVLFPYDALPLTPEMREKELEAEQALIEEEHRRRQAQVQAKWQSYRPRDIRSCFVAEADPDVFFDDRARGILVGELSIALLTLDSSHFANCALYLQKLERIIEDSEDLEHQAILNTVTRTYADSDIGLFGDENLRRALLVQKTSFFFNLLKEEANYLSNEFDIECQYRRHRIEPAHRPVVNNIQEAVATAQANYEKWYKKENNLRGDDGYFSRFFFRHGEFGQWRAASLNNEILESSDYETAASLANNFLQSCLTRYNRHSFASFLLDELSKIPNSPWSDIAPDDTKLYDKDRVIELLDSHLVTLQS